MNGIRFSNPRFTTALLSETYIRGTVCGKSARTGLWGSGEVTTRSTRKSKKSTMGAPAPAKCIFCKSELNRCNPFSKWGVLIIKMPKTEQVMVKGCAINSYSKNRTNIGGPFAKSKLFFKKISCHTSIAPVYILSVNSIRVLWEIMRVK